MSFSRDLSIAADLTAFVSKEVRTLGIKIDQGVVLGTPVDTGAARANWLVGINNPPASAVEDTDKGGSKSIQAGLAVIGAYPTTALPDMWIVNNLPYISELNDGSSAQAPSKYVDVIIQRVVANG